MKKIFLLFLSLIMLFSLSSCTISEEKEKGKTYEKESFAAESVQNKFAVKSVWISYYEFQKLLENKNQKEFERTIDTQFKNLRDIGFNTVTVQVRPFADAFYNSEYFPSSAYAFGKQGVKMPFDPFEIICVAAEKYSLRVEAWINPYRVSTSPDISKLSNDNTAKKWAKNKKTKSNVFIFKKGIYFNPASKRVTKLIVNGVSEIVRNYKVASIHFDDYFYPSESKDIDKKEYKNYLKSGGKMSLSDFRRDRVSNMIKSVYSAVKKENKNVLFGVSPASDIENDRSVLFADVEKWASEKGYVDYICPQIYFGFKNEKQPFMFTAKKWKSLAKCKLYVGLPLYKAGKKDKYAASENTDAVNEFKNNDDIISRQIKYLSKLGGIDGIYIFSYGSLFNEKSEKESENLKKILKNY